jgi:homoserine O-acetyltransferase
MHMPCRFAASFLIGTGLVSLWCAVALAGAPAPEPDVAPTGPHPSHETFVLDDFQLASGQVVNGFRLSYVTYGVLNSTRSNAILISTGFGLDHHAYDGLIGPDLAFDPNKYLIIVVDIFNGGLSSSPSNTPSPLHGPNFPEISVRDNVDAAYRLTTERFGIRRLAGAAGFSMGAQIAFQWAVSYPDFVDSVIPWCGTAKTYPHGVVRLEGFKSAISADAAFDEGAYTAPPEKGLRAAARGWASWAPSQEWWRRELFKQPPFNHRSVEEHLTNFWEARFVSLDANDLLSQAVTWQTANVGDTPGFGGDHEKTLRSTKSHVLYMPCQTDLYYPIGDARYEARLMRRVTLKPIPSIWGHLAGLGIDRADRDFLNQTIRAFLTVRRAQAR